MDLYLSFLFPHPGRKHEPERLHVFLEDSDFLYNFSTSLFSEAWAPFQLEINSSIPEI